MEKKEKSYEEVWKRIGFVVNLSQMMEYNIANILALNKIIAKFEQNNSMLIVEYNELAKKAKEYYEKLCKKELGNLQKAIETKEIFDDEFVEEINNVREERNYFIHHIFKDDLRSKEFQNNPEKFATRLEELIGKMSDINDILCKIMTNMQTLVKMIY